MINPLDLSLLIKTPVVIPSDMSGMGYLDILAAPFGGPINGKDIVGAYFDKDTDFMEDMIPTPGLFYWHGRMTGSGLDRYGEIVYRWMDNDGVWFRVKLDLNTETGNKLWKAALDEKAYASTGVVPASYEMDKETGRIKSWLIGDLTLIDEDINAGRIPANYYAVAKPALKNLMFTQVPEDKRELFENVFLTDGEVERPSQEGESEDEGEPEMKRDLLAIKAYLMKAAMMAGDLASSMKDEVEDPELEDVIAKCAECQGKGMDEQVKTVIRTLTGEVSSLRQKLAETQSATWASEQIAAGRATPAEKDQLVKTLMAAHGTGSAEMVKTVMAMVESRPVTPVTPVISAPTNLRVAGFDSGSGDDVVDENYIRQIMQFVGPDGGKK